MDVSVFQEFVVLAETCSYQEAADKLFTTVSTLSKHISKLETELGMSLFDRTTRSVALNKNGQTFYDYAVQMNRLYQNCIRTLGRNDPGNQQRFTVAFLPVLGQYGMVELLAEFRKEHPDVEFEIIESEKPMELLMARECEFAFDGIYGMIDPFPNRFNRVLIDQDDLVAVFPVDHPLAQETSVSIRQLSKEKFILHQTKDSKLTNYLQKLCSDAGFRPQTTATISFTSTIAKMVAEGMGIAVMNRRHTPFCETENVKVVSLTPRQSFNIYMYYPSGYKLSEHETRFLAFSQNRVNIK